jgi:hypothetical protein
MYAIDESTSVNATLNCIHDVTLSQNLRSIGQVVTEIEGRGAYPTKICHFLGFVWAGLRESGASETIEVL